MRDRDDDRDDRRSRRGSSRYQEDEDERPRRRSRDDDDGGSGRTFKYKRNEDRGKEMKNRAQGGAGFDNPFKKDVPIFTASKDGDYTMRILPATWEGAKGYVFDVFIHYNIGADKGRFICLRKQYGEDCPVCEEYEKAKRAGDEDYARDIKPTQRAAAYVILRGDEEKNGPQLFPMPVTLDQEIARRSEDKKSKEVLYIDDPDEGFDVSFTRETGKGGTRYVGVELDRSPSPITDRPKTQAKWLQFITDNPIPGMLVRKDYDYIAKTFKGSKSKADEEEDDEDEKPRRRFRNDKDDDERDARRSRKDPDEDDTEDEEDEDDRPRRKRRDDDEDEKPHGKRRRDEDEEIDDEDAELDEEDEKPKSRKRLDDDDDEPRQKEQKRRRTDPDEDDEDEAPKRKRAKLNDDDEDEAPRRSRKDDDEPDDEDDESPRPLKRRRRSEDDD